MSRTREKTDIEKARDEAVNALRGHEPDSAEYKKVLKNVRELNAMVCESKPERPSPDALVKALALVGTTLIIVAYEQRNVWATKAGNFLSKML